MEHRLVFLVGKRHPIEFYTAHDLGPAVCARPLQLVVALHELEHPIAGHHTHLKRIKAVCKLPKRTIKHVDEQGKGGQITNAYAARIHQRAPASVPNCQPNRQGRQHVNYGQKQRKVPYTFNVGIAVPLVYGLKTTGLLTLAAKKLNHGNARNPLLYKGVERCDLVSDVGKSRLNALLKPTGRQKKNRDYRQTDGHHSRVKEQEHRRNHQENFK